MSFLRRLWGWIPLRILDRYIARQLLLSTFMAVAVLSVILVLGQIFRSLLDLMVQHQLPIGKLLGFVWDMFAYSLSFTVPWGLLTSVLLVFGRLSADNELTSMRMAGMSLFRICLPVLLIAGGLSLFCYFINTKVAPQAYKRLKSEKFTLALENPLALFEPGRVIDAIPGYRMYCSAKEGDRLKNFQIVVMDSFEPPSPTTVLMATEAQLVPVPAERRIDLIMKDMTIINHALIDEMEEGRKMTHMEVSAPIHTLTSPMPVDLTKFWENANKPRVDGMSMGELRWVYAYADPDPKFSSGPADQVLVSALAGMDVKEKRKLRSEAITEYNSRFSFSLACFTLALVGICFGITAQRRETSAGFVLSLIVGILYFAFIMLGALLKDKPEYHPQLWVWLPNVLFGAMGLLLFWRLQRR